MATNFKTQQELLKEAGFLAAVIGRACDAPTSREADRAAWEQGWRAGQLWRAGCSICGQSPCENPAGCRAEAAAENYDG